jgi:hypothetical protein
MLKAFLLGVLTKIIADRLGLLPGNALILVVVVICLTMICEGVLELLWKRATEIVKRRVSSALIWAKKFFSVTRELEELKIKVEAIEASRSTNGKLGCDQDKRSAEQLDICND